MRPLGGIGRRSGFKIHRPQGRTGSTPVEAMKWGLVKTSARKKSSHTADSNLKFLADACRALVNDPLHNDFWVLSGLTDRSYEEGDRNQKFKWEIKAYESAGLSPAMSEQLRLGINGNLKTILSSQFPEISIKRNKWAGQDLTIRSPRKPDAVVEIKLIFDCTMPKYFKSLAHDLEKLHQRRADGFTGELFAVVFFATLPEYLYPRGLWFDKQWRSRSAYMRNCGIANQFVQAVERMKCKPIWPAKGAPYIREMKSLAHGNYEVVCKLINNNFQTDEPWQFNPKKHLRKAEIGVGIWQM
jgi:hypothetical protein